MDDPLDQDPDAARLTGGRTARQRALAALIGETITRHAVDFGGGDVTAVMPAPSATGSSTRSANPA